MENLFRITMNASEQVYNSFRKFSVVFSVGLSQYFNLIPAIVIQQRRHHTNDSRWLVGCMLKQKLCLDII